MKTYPWTKQLEDAVRRLYSDNDAGRLALGIVGPPAAARESLGNSSTPYDDRIRQLRGKLEGWVELYADELGEFEGEQDTLRIRSEARAILMALRELHRLFPEVVA